MENTESLNSSHFGNSLKIRTLWMTIAEAMQTWLTIEMLLMLKVTPKVKTLGRIGT